MFSCLSNVIIISMTVIDLNFQTLIDLPSIPYLICLNITGPGDVNLTAQAIINKTGEITINIDNETIISSSRLKTILIPLNGDSYKGTTGTPFISSVRDCNILNVKYRELIEQNM